MDSRRNKKTGHVIIPGVSQPACHNSLLSQMVAGRRDSQTNAMVDSPTSGCRRRGPAHADTTTARTVWRRTHSCNCRAKLQAGEPKHTYKLLSVSPTYSLYTSGQKSLPYYIYIYVVATWGKNLDKYYTSIYIEAKKKWNLIFDVTTQCLHLKTTASIPALGFLHTRYSLHGYMEGPPL